MQVGGERFEASDALFQPHLINKEGQGMAELVFSAIQSADIDIRPELYKHIVVGPEWTAVLCYTVLRSCRAGAPCTRGCPAGWRGRSSSCTWSASSRWAS